MNLGVLNAQGGLMGIEAIGFNGVPSKTLPIDRPQRPLFDLRPIGNPYNAAPWNSQNASASIYEDWGTH